MSRRLLALSLLVLLVAGLAPVGLVLARLTGHPEVVVELLDPRTLGLLERTLRLGLGAAVIALLLGVPFGWLTTRTDLFLARLWRVLGLVPLILPPLIMAVTWIMVTDLRGEAVTIFLMGLATFPLVSVFTAKAAERIDARRQEAALLAGGLRAVIRSELPLLLPAAMCGACFAFVFAINDFGLPDYVSSKGPKFNVYADEIFARWQVDPQPGISDAKAVASALPLIALTLVALLPALFLRRRGSLATVDADFQRPAPLSLGIWQGPALLFCAGLVTLGAGIPIGRLLFEAGGGRTGPWTYEGLARAFTQALELCRENLLASLLFAAGAATVAAPFALVIGHAITRSRRGWMLEILSVLPIAAPAILFGIGNIVLWNRPGTYGFYASGALVITMLVGRFMTFPILAQAGASAALDPHLEEAAALAGAGPAKRLARVVAPPLIPSLAGGWILVFVLAMRELDTAILVPAANQTAMFRMFNAVHFGRDDFVAALGLMIIFVTIAPGLLWTLLVGRRLEVLP